MTDQVSFYSQHTEADPTRRSYSVGDQAMREVVRMAQDFGTVAVDIETAGLGALAFTVKVVIIATANHSCVLDASDDRHRASAKEAMSIARKLVFHNSSFDVPPMVAAGIMRIEDIDKVVDTLVYARMALTGERDGRRLADLEKRFLSADLRSATKDNLAEWGKVNKLKKAEIFSRANYSDPVYAMYAGWDGILTSMLLPRVRDAARHQITNHPFGKYGADEDQVAYLLRREQRVNRVMLKRSARGIRVDVDRITGEQERIRLGMNSHADTLAALGVKDPSNRNQLAAVLEETDALPEDYPRTEKTNRPKTDGDNLATLDHPAAQAFTRHDDLRRLFTYLENARLVAGITGGRIHPQVNVLHARTGRMSYSNPALQQFTAPARESLTFDDECGVSIDWAAIEPCIAANLAGDSQTIDLYESGQDIYAPAVRAASITRKHAKIVVLAMLYGQGIRSLAADLGVELDRAKEVRAHVASTMPQINRLTGWAAVWSGDVGRTWTVSGRIVNVDHEFGYKGTNYLVQGSAYDILAESIVAVDAAGLSDAVYLAMHDELVVAESAAGDIREIMQTPPERLVELSGRVPLLRTDMAELGDRWTTPDE